MNNNWMSTYSILELIPPDSTTWKQQLVHATDDCKLSFTRVELVHFHVHREQHREQLRVSL